MTNTTLTTIADVQADARRLSACREAREWLATQTDIEADWQTCERPDWLIWYAVRRGVDRRTIVLIACDCAETALPYAREQDRPILVAALTVSRAWTRGEGGSTQRHKIDHPQLWRVTRCCRSRKGDSPDHPCPPHH